MNKSENSCDLGYLKDINKPHTSEYKIENHYNQSIPNILLKIQLMPSNYFCRQINITNQYRCSVVNWVSHVSAKFELNHSTFFLGVSIFDRFLIISQPIKKSYAQPLAFVALAIAAKLEETRDTYDVLPMIKYYFNSEVYNMKEYVEMEHEVIATLNGDMYSSTVYHFLKQYIDTIQGSNKLYNLSCFIVECNVQQEIYFNCYPHVFAAVGLYIAIKSIDVTNEWPHILPNETNISEDTLLSFGKEFLKNMYEETQSMENAYKSIKRKYGNHEYLTNWTHVHHWLSQTDLTKSTQPNSTYNNHITSQNDGKDISEPHRKLLIR